MIRPINSVVTNCKLNPPFYLDPIVLRMTHELHTNVKYLTHPGLFLAHCVFLCFRSPCATGLKVLFGPSGFTSTAQLSSY